MQDNVVSLAAAQAAKNSQPDDPNARLIADLTGAAMQRAATTAAVMIGTLEGRKLRKGDVTAIARAIESAWEVETFRIMGDESLSAEARGMAAKVWSQRRHIIIDSARKMARSLVG